MSARTNSEPVSALGSSGPGESPNIIPSLNPVPDPAILTNVTLPVELGPDIIISAGGQRRGLRGPGRRRGFEQGRGVGRGRGLTFRRGGGSQSETSNQNPTDINSTQAVPAQNPSRSRGRFVPLRTFVFRPGRGGPRARSPRGTTFIHRNILPNVNLVITSSGKK